MLAALTLCLGLQSGVAGVAPDPGPRALHVFIEDETGTLLVDGWSVRLGRITSTSVHWSLQWTQSRGVDATTGLVEFSLTSDEAWVAQAVHDTGVVSGWEQIVFPPGDDDPGPIVHRLVFEGPTPERSLFVTVLDPLELSNASTLRIYAIARTGAEVP